MAKYHIVYFAYGSENSLRQINMHNYVQDMINRVFKRAQEKKIPKR